MAKISRKNPALHIYPLSRLVNALPHSWERLIKSIEDGKERAFGYYLPMREAAVLFCSKRGSDFDFILDNMRRRAEEMGGRSGPKIAEDNERALRVFVECFYPQLGKFKRDCLREAQDGVEIEGLLLFGAPHFIANDRKGVERYVFLLPAEWDHADLKAYLQLLAVIVECKYGGAASQIWCMDLRSRRSVKPVNSPRLRSRCMDTARLFVRLTRAVQTE